MAKTWLMPVFMYHNPDHKDFDKKFVVVEVESWNYKDGNTEWMADVDLPEGCEEPSIDIIKEKHFFSTEQEAVTKVAQLYAKQLLGL